MHQQPQQPHFSPTDSTSYPTTCRFFGLSQASSWLPIAVISCALIGCKGKDITETVVDAKACPVEQEKTEVQNYMEDVYLWAAYVKKIDVQNYITSSDVVDALAVKNLNVNGYSITDKWSYITKLSDQQALQNAGTYKGYGYKCIQQYTNLDSCTLAFVYPNTPMASLGLQRGDTILNVTDNTNSAIFTYRKAADGLVQTRTLTPADISIDTLLVNSIIKTPAHTVGYLVFQSFSTPSDAQLVSLINSWKAAKVDKVVLDLRYNGGGLVATANTLASLLAGQNVNNRVFAKLNYNKNYASWNETLSFNNHANALNLQQLVVITSAETCSASELLVNGLSPFIEVVTVGDKTCGKPVGMIGINVCDKVLYPISFSLTNAYDRGAYFNGISPTCPAIDNLNFPLGNTQESSLAQALHFIDNGICSNNTTAASNPYDNSVAQAKLVKPTITPNLNPDTGWQQEVGAR